MSGSMSVRDEVYLMLRNRRRKLKIAIKRWRICAHGSRQRPLVPRGVAGFTCRYHGEVRTSSAVLVRARCPAVAPSVRFDFHTTQADGSISPSRPYQVFYDYTSLLILNWLMLP